MTVRMFSKLMLLVSLTCCFAGGCSTSNKAVRAGTYQVDLKVWAILNFNETLGNPSNNGCRLTMQQITDIVNQLQKNASVYGVNTKFNWDGTINIFSASISSRSYPLGNFINDISGDPPNWTSDVVNVYFVGSLDDTSVGSTLGPDAYAPTGDRFATPFVRIGDGGLNGPGSNVTILQKRLTLEHEVCHYIGRFADDVGMVGNPSQIVGKTYGTGVSARMYNGSEHLQGNSYLMSSAPTYDTQRMLVIPGVETPQQFELGEVSQRIKAGTWNSP